MFLFASASTDVDVLVIMVTNEVQAEDVLYGHLGAVEGIHLCYPSFKLRADFHKFFFNNISAIPSGTTVVLASTVSPAFVSQLERRLESKLYSGLILMVRCFADHFTSIMIFYCHLIEFYNLLGNLLDEGKDLKLVDAPVSGGVKRAAMGELTVRSLETYIPCL